MTPGDYSFWTLYYDGLYYTGSYDLDLGAGRSLKVPTGWSVSLYTNDGCAGTPFTKTTDDSCFADLGLLIQSIRVETNGIKTMPDFGNVIWARPSQTKAAAYSAGFTNQIQAFVSSYHYTTNGSQLNFSAGAIVLQNPDSSQSVTNEFSMDSASKATGANKLNLTVVNSSGAFKGSLKNPLTGKQTSFSGVVLQKQNFGRGFFFDGDQSGLVWFGP